MRGRSIPLSPFRRLVIDVTRFAVPSVPVQRGMRLAAVAAARAACPVRPAWTALFAKAYALVAAECPELRRAYVKLPWPHLYEYPVSVAAIAVEREHRGEKGVLFARIRDPARMPLAEISRAVRKAASIPVEADKDFGRALRVSRLPGPLRRALWWFGLNVGRQRANYFGTFGISVYSALGVESLHPLSPLTVLLNYGVISDTGVVDVRAMYDHRVVDGATIARALVKLEDTMNGPILAELRALAQP